MASADAAINESPLTAPKTLDGFFLRVSHALKLSPYDAYTLHQLPGNKKVQARVYCQARTGLDFPINET